jgi:thymidylate kinase
MTTKKTPLVISFMGVDGSGKTTLSKIITKKFKQSKYLHLKPYILFKDLRRVIKKPYNQKKSKFIISLLRLISWLISYKIFFYQNKKKKFYIFDRYAHDILIDPLRYKHNLSKNLTKFLLNFFPRPDLWIFLNPPFKTIKSRKLELSNGELRRQTMEYSNFFKKEKNVLTLNTNTQSKILVAKIKKKINFIIK